MYGIKTPLQHHSSGVAIKPLVAENGIAASTTHNGETIALNGARFITFCLVGAAATGGIVGTHTCEVHGSVDGTNFEALESNDGTTNLAFTAADVSSGGKLETQGFLNGTVDMTRVDGHSTLGDSKPWTHVRLVWVSASASTASVAASYFTSESPEAGGLNADTDAANRFDDLLSKQHKSWA